jgi:uncharacterized SAM-binding protein YcdF (DUF218 family)
VSDETDLDTIAAWLALEDPEQPVDLLLLFGAALPDAWAATAEAVRRGRVGTVMAVGGRGHTTDLWLDLVGAEAGRREADVVAEHLAAYGIRALRERESTNCGDNVVRARALATELGLAPRTVALVQDPSMQRRMDAVFRQVWPEATPVNRPAAPPGVHAVGWPAERWRQLVVGEVPRLRDDAGGYGPRGAGYLAHVDVPDEVEAAYAGLVRRHPEWAREADPRHAS